MKQGNFIRCSDSETIQKLKEAGFQLIEEKDSVAVFLNDLKKRFDFQNSPIAFSNIYTATS